MITFGQLQKDVATLSEEEQDKLAAYLTMLRKSRATGYDQELTDRVAEERSEKWIAYNRPTID